MPSPIETRQSAHWSILGLVRFFLAWVVVCAHLGYVGVRDHWWIAEIYAFGSAEAVIAFFVLSGYSIAHSISRSPQGYLMRRIIRIYPVYLTSLMLGLIPFYVWGNAIESSVGPIPAIPLWPTIFYDFFLVQFITGKTVGVTGVAWSLSVEWLFYCLAPYFHRGRSQWILLCVFFSAICWLSAPNSGMAWSNPEYWTLDCGLTPLLIGWAWLSCSSLDFI